MKRRNRLDLSNWITHFVHTNDPKNAPVLKNGFNATYHPDYEQFIEFVQKQRNYFEQCERGFADDDNNLDCIYPPFSLWQTFEEDDEPFEDGSPPLEVLKRILKTGYIRAGWSFRNGRPTIYGERAACCFTEMPLYALLNYARERADKITVSHYGIAFDRNELFRAGARPAIYGLSGRHQEDPTKNGWPRLLSSSCGIGLQEQFRYVAMSEDGKIDWTHEREWRWPFDRNRCDCPGLPILLRGSSIEFSTIIIFVPTTKEAEEVLDLLKLMHDAESFNLGEWQYDLERIKRTRVLSVEEATQKIGNKSLQNLRFEDIPLHTMPIFKRPIPSKETIARVQLAIDEARAEAQKAGEAYRNTFPESYRFPDFGCAFLICRSSQSEFIAAIESLAHEQQIHVTPLSEATSAGYQIEGIPPPGATARGTVGEGLYVVKALIETLNRHFPDIDFVALEHFD